VYENKHAQVLFACIIVASFITSMAETELRPDPASLGASIFQQVPFTTV